MFQYVPNCYFKLVPNTICKRKFNKKKIVFTKGILLKEYSIQKSNFFINLEGGLVEQDLGSNLSILLTSCEALSAC